MSTAAQPASGVSKNIEITHAIVAEHGVTPDEYQRILATLGRTPTLTELGIYSVMWSEHCSYKSSRVHLKRLPTKGSIVLQGPGENAGIIDVGNGWACAFKIESHNHPSFIEPHQGAATGVGGILRDIFTMGARPLAVMDSLRFGPLAPTSQTDKATAHKNHSILEGVVSGIASYGNCFGVPNLGGETRFEDCYSQNPLVNAFALGLVRKDQIFYAKAAGVGNPVIYVGAMTGRDGIHGATMASEEFKEGSEQKRPNVQVGDPFLEKLLLEACLEVMQSGAVVGIQDMGAAGLTCSTCEMGARGGVGLEIELDNVPQRESGMNSYEIMLSESQERMLLVAESGREQEVLAIFAKWGLDAVVIGKVIAEARMRVRHHGELVADIPNTSLTDDAPLYNRPMAPWIPHKKFPAEKPAAITFKADTDFNAEFRRLLAAPNIASKRWIYEQYDSMVQTNTVEGPGSDAGVMRIKGTKRGLAMSLDGNGRWCYLDPKLGAMLAVAESARNVACSGGRPVACTDNMNFGNPEKPPIMQQFSDVVDGIAEACNALNTPITGGNVSLYNETLGEGIYPTPVIGMVGIIDDINKICRSHFSAQAATSPRDIIMLQPKCAGDLADRITRFGSSEYARTVQGIVWGLPPALDLAAEKSLQSLLLRLIDEGLIESAHDISDGGFTVALAECCFPLGIGAKVEVKSHKQPIELALFGETATRVVLSAIPEHSPRIKELAVESGLEAYIYGQTQAEKFEISVDGKPAIITSMKELQAHWERTLPSILEGA